MAEVQDLTVPRFMFTENIVRN